MKIALSSKKSLLLAVLLVGIAAVLATLFLLGRKAYFTGLEQRTDETFGVSLSVPHSWAPYSHTDGQLEFHATDQDQHSATARILITRQSEVASDWSELGADIQKNIVDDILADTQAGKYNFGFESPGTATINSLYGITGETVETNSHYTSDMRGLAFISVSPDGVLYKVVAMVPAEDFHANKSAMQKIIESFSYVKEETEN